MVAYLSLGSNIEDKKKYLQQAVFLLKQDPRIKILDESLIYKTEPVGLIGQSWFLNKCIKIETDLSPQKLLNVCQQIEEQLGRKRTVRFGPRTIDVDILLYGDLIIDEPDLQIPHPRMTERWFVLQPLRKIAGEVVHPVEKKTIEKLLEECRDGSNVIKL